LLTGVKIHLIYNDIWKQNAKTA